MNSYHQIFDDYELDFEQCDNLFDNCFCSAAYEGLTSNTLKDIQFEMVRDYCCSLNNNNSAILKTKFFKFIVCVRS